MATLTPVSHILRRLPYLLRRTLIACFDDGLFTIAKGAAYSALLSFFPVLTTAAAIFVQVQAKYVQRSVTDFLHEILPPGTEQIVMDQFRQRGQRPVSLLIVAIFVSLWAASAVITSLIDGFNAAYRVPRSRSALGHNAVGIMLVFFALVPLLLASGLVLFGGSVERQVLYVLKIDPVLMPLSETWEFLSHLLRYAIALTATASFTAIIYYYGPYRQQRWAAVWPGAVLSTALWFGATSVFGWYVTHITNYNVLYGSVGSSIALLVWMYLLAAIALFGCEFNAEIERLRT